MKKLHLLAVVVIVLCVSVAHAEIAAEKRLEIEKMLQLTGMEQLMAQIKTQITAVLKSQMPQVPEAFWTKLEQKMDTRELLEKIIPLYDRHYTTEDLKAINAFYQSPAGRKVVSTLPQIMQESMMIGREWGEKMGKQAAEEAQQELKKSGQK